MGVEVEVVSRDVVSCVFFKVELLAFKLIAIFARVKG